MRVHPSILRPSNTSWQLPVAVLIFLVVVGVLLAKRGEEPADAAYRVPMKMVVVVKNAITAGEVVDRVDLVLENRPATTLPADVITDFEDIKGKIALGPIPAGYPLAKALLKSQDDVSDVVPIDPIEAKLAEIRSKTVAITLDLGSNPPSRGSRIALSIKSEGGNSVLVAEEIWVEQSSPNWTQLRVEPMTALFLEEAKALGSFSYFEIPQEGASPFAGQAITDIHELKKKLQAQRENYEAKTSSRNEKEKVNFSGYAWVTGKGVKYSVRDNGQMYVIGNDGKARPLHGRAEIAEDESNAPDGQQKNSRRIETGLEVLYPVMGVEVE